MSHHIVADETGKILAEGTELVGGITYNGVVPDDFRNTYALGKYQFINNEIVAVPGWVAPIQPVDPFATLSQVV